MRTSALILLVAVIFVSGCCCANSPPYNMNGGIIISEFYFDFYYIYDYEVSDLSLGVKNVGAKEVAGDYVSVFVYGHEIVKDGSNSTMLWFLDADPSVELNDDSISARVSSSILNPENATSGVPGGERLFTLRFDPPNIPDGDEKYTFNARVCYPYFTEISSQLNLISFLNMKYSWISNTDADRINASGPIRIYVRDVNITSDTHRSRLLTSMVLNIRDFDGGFPTLESVTCAAKINDSKRNIVHINVTVDGEPADCGDGIVKIKDSLGTLYCTKTLESTDNLISNFNV